MVAHSTSPLAPDEPTDEPVPLEYVRAIAEYLRSGGFRTQQLLDAAKLPALELVRPGGTVPFSVFRRLMDTAAEMTGEPAIGLLVGERTDISTHGPVGAAAAHSKTVGEAIDIIERFAPIRTGLISIHVDRRELISVMAFRELAPMAHMRRPVLELAVVTVSNVLREITYGAAVADVITFAFPDPGYAKLAREVLGVPVRYGADWSGFSLPNDVLRLPVRRRDDEIYAESAQLCRDELQAIAEATTWAARLRRVFLEYHDHRGFPSLNVASRVLHVNPRTLHRRLEDEGTSYRAQLDSVRQTLAASYLSSPQLGLQEIAYRLGYTDPANFRRAFKRLSGQTPTQFRASHGALRSAKETP